MKEVIVPFYKYLKDKYPVIKLYKELGINITLDSPYTLLIRTGSFLEERNCLEVSIYNPVILESYFTFDINGDITEKNKHLKGKAHILFRRELEKLKEHIKEFFTPNSIKFIRDI